MAGIVLDSGEGNSERPSEAPGLAERVQQEEFDGAEQHDFQWRHVVCPRLAPEAPLVWHCCSAVL